MTMTALNTFMSGAIAMGFGVISLFFYSFWRRSRISLFGLFGLAFTLLAIERIVLIWSDAQDEFKPFIYLIRLAAFLVIIIGIVVQNRRSD
jgi:membrane protein CcdC involved in cytochrome C biogenesis